MTCLVKNKPIFMRIGKKPKKNKISFDVLNAKELTQKL
jgi:hypothetical protein